jgi:hypothetical protein
MIKRYYVTLFDSNYLTRGLIMYRSLLRHSGEFHLWIVCFDNLAYEILDKLRLEKVTLVPLEQFEDNELLSIKAERTYVEYMWTCTPSVALYVLNTDPSVDAVTYLDADLMFFSSPEPIFAEMNQASVLITEHRYLPEFDQSEYNGIYNVQFVMFRRDDSGLETVRWWRDRCIEWCFYRAEDNKLGDQKYLDDWPQRFKGVHVLQHLGGGLAPWNVSQYNLSKIDNQVYVERYPLIFYHFHALKLYSEWLSYLFPNYPITKQICEWIYRPYLESIGAAYNEVRSIHPTFKKGITDVPNFPPKLFDSYRFIKESLRDFNSGRYFKYSI